MKTLILIVIGLVLTGCNKSSDSPPAQPEDPIYGAWTHTMVGSTSTKKTGYTGIISKDGNVTTTKTFEINDGTATVRAYRKNVGKFVRNGEEFKVTYSYETCGPIKEETFYLSHKNNQLVLTDADKSYFIYFDRAKEAETVVNLTVIEDKDCKIITKLESKQKRTITSEGKKPKTFFDLPALD